MIARGKTRCCLAIFGVALACLLAGDPWPATADEPGLTLFGWSDQHVQTNGDASHLLPVHLILTSANSPGNESSVLALESRYRNRGYTGFVIDRKSFTIAHDDVAGPSFDWAIDLI